MSNDTKKHLQVIQFKEARKWRLRYFREQVRTDCNHLGFLNADKTVQQQIEALNVLELIYVNKIHRELEGEIVMKAEKQLHCIIQACKRQIGWLIRF